MILRPLVFTDGLFINNSTTDLTISRSFTIATASSSTQHVASWVVEVRYGYCRDCCGRGYCCGVIVEVVVVEVGIVEVAVV